MNLLRFALALALGLAAGIMPARAQQSDAPFVLQRGDHVVVIGNTLAERMQHDGWLETLLHARFPGHQLVYRDLGYSGDEITLRLRSAGFGTPDEHLLIHRADVIFAFFGFNESFAGPAGLPKFKADLEAWVRHTLAQKYNGRSSPRLVLFSPIAHENLRDPNLPDGAAQNERMAPYVSAMREVASVTGARFVDLFAPTAALYKSAPRFLTINGVHLNAEGNRQLAQIIDAALFGANAAPPLDPRRLEALRGAVLDKNFHWFNRYRTVDGYSIYGGRADLAFVDGQTNREVARREMEVLDVMTANRDARIWAMARGEEASVDDSNTPPFIPVKTNKPGNGPFGAHLFLDGEEAISKMTPGQGLRVNLFASEKQFPELANPVQMAFDTRGRLFVAVMPSYPHWKPKEEYNDKILILEDTDGDGRADVCKTFADRLHVPTGLEFWNGGLFVGAQPDLLFLKDTDGDDVADLRVRVLHGIDSADTHHALNSFTLDPGGALYFQEGTFHHTQVETPYGVERCANAGVFRYEPRTHKFDVFVSYPFANPHGHVFDRWGQNFITDGTTEECYFAAAFSGRIDFPDKHNRVRPFFQQRTRPCPATEILSSAHFPPENQGNYLVANVIGFLGILQYKLRDDGSGFAAVETEPILSSTDANFRPSDLEIGPDGALYFTDWQNPIIGHMQHNLRDPSRDKTHGRVYRVTCANRPLLKPAQIAGASIEELLELLKDSGDRVRYRARIELSARSSERVVAAARRWIAGLDRNDPEYAHHLLEGLWVHQQHNVVDVPLLVAVLKSSDFRARAAATRVLCYWRDRVPEPLALLRTLAADEHPRVRLEAVRASSFFREPEAVEVALISAEHPSDDFLNYTRAETMRALQPAWKKALAEGQTIAFTSEAGMRYLVRGLSTEELLKARPSRAVHQEILSRPGLRDDQRRAALAALARMDGKTELSVLLELLAVRDQSAPEGDDATAYDLVRLLASRNSAELQQARAAFERMAVAGRLPLTRQIALIGLVSADGTPEKAWKLANGSPRALVDFLAAVPMLPDPNSRAELFSRIAPMLRGLPEGLSPRSGGLTGVDGRFVRIELPGRRTLTLAEVEVISGGKNVARQGLASQKNTAHGGEAQRGIDGNSSGSYGDGGQTHTEENTNNPFWEVDLRREYPIEAVVIHNRTDGDLGRRLDGFTLKILDHDRNEQFVLADQPAPSPRVRIEPAGADPAARVRHQAMAALVSVRGQEAAAFKLLAPLVRGAADRPAALAALLRIPADHWPAEGAPALLDDLLLFLKSLSPRERTGQVALDALQVCHQLTTFLPADEAKRTRALLNDLGVRMIKLTAVPHQMAFDKERLVVQAGKPIEFILENADIMPHNFAITQPGALAEIGELAEAQATQPGALERHFVPQHPKILLASVLLQPRQVQKLAFTVPGTPGVYPYVCTYPGHWRRMYGALYVVADLDAYLADPDGYLAANPMAPQDELLKYIRQRKEWKLEELAAGVEELAGRSFNNARQLFQVAACVSCHRLNEAGNAFGPDLAKLDEKMTPLDVLKELLDPSAKINEKFYVNVFETESGKTISGLVIEENADEVKIVENPLASPAATVIRKKEIASREKSNTSLMPKGLLDKLTREEILDLIAYVVARGNKNHKVFHENGHHHH